jgi:hypothetical protein
MKVKGGVACLKLKGGGPTKDKKEKDSKEIR